MSDSVSINTYLVNYIIMTLNERYFSYLASHSVLRGVFIFSSCKPSADHQNAFK